jgi:hypothetical protein
MHLPHFDIDILTSQRAYEFQPHKSQLRESDLHDLFTFIWARDQHNFDHPRYRVQVALSLLLIFHLGLHPKAAFNEGLYYRDTNLLLTRRNGELRVVLLICLKNRHKVSRSSGRWTGCV